MKIGHKIFKCIYLETSFGWLDFQQFSIFFYSFQDFYKRFWQNARKRFVYNLAQWPSWCLEKNPTFFGTPTLSVCQIFCRQKFKNLSIQIVDKPLTSILPKPFVKILKTVEEDRKMVRPYPTSGSGNPSSWQPCDIFFSPFWVAYKHISKNQTSVYFKTKKNARGGVSP